MAQRLKAAKLPWGQNVLITYMPWEGYNYEDAILLSERLVYEDVYTSIHQLKNMRLKLAKLS